MVLNRYGYVVKEHWLKTMELRKNIVLDKFIIMPDHVHGIVVITKDNVIPEPLFNKIKKVAPFKSPHETLGSIVRRFKASSTSALKGLNPIVGEKVWQTNYYDTIIRDKEHLNRIRGYIIQNPRNYIKPQLDKIWNNFVK